MAEELPEAAEAAVPMLLLRRRRRRAGQDRPEVIRALHEAGDDVDQPNPRRFTPLLIAATSNSPNAAALLLELGADLLHRNCAVRVGGPSQELTFRRRHA